MENTLQDQFVGSSLANVIFAVGIGIVIYIQKRCGRSRCGVHSSWFDCESSLTELKDEVKAQNTKHLENFQELLDVLKLKESESRISVAKID